MHTSLEAERDAIAGDWASLAEQCISQYADCAREHADLCGQEMAMEAHRPVLLAEIRARVMGDPSAPNTNPLTNKAHSASSAEEAARIDPEYVARLTAQSQVVAMKNTAHGLAQAAWLRASLAIARFKAAGGLL